MQESPEEIMVSDTVSRLERLRHMDMSSRLMSHGQHVAGPVAAILLVVWHCLLRAWIASPRCHLKTSRQDCKLVFQVLRVPCANRACLDFVVNSHTSFHF